MSVLETLAVSLSKFPEPASLTLVPDSDDLAAVGGDPSLLVVASWDAVSGVWTVMDVTVGQDGGLSVQLQGPTTVLLLVPAAPPSPQADALGI